MAQLSNKKIKRIKRLQGTKSAEEIARELRLRVDDVRAVIDPDFHAQKARGQRLQTVALFDLGLVCLFILLVAAAPLAPLLLIKQPAHDPIDLIQTLYVQVGGALLLLLWLARSAFARPWRVHFSGFELPIAGFVVWAALSMTWAVNRYEGLYLVRLWGASALVHFLAVQIIREQRHVRWLFGAILAAALTAATIGICQAKFGYDAIPQAAPPASVFANKNMACQYMVLCLPVLICVFLGRLRKPTGWIFAGGMVAVGTYVLIARTRAAWLAVLTEVVLIACGLGWQLTRKWPRRRAHLCAAAVVAVCVLSAVLLVNYGPMSRRGDLKKALVSARYLLIPSDDLALDDINKVNELRTVMGVSFHARVCHNYDTASMMRSRLFRGYGAGSWPIHYVLFSRCAHLGRHYTISQQTVHAHNDYLQAGSEMGIVSLLFVGWFAIAFIWQVFALAGKTRGNRQFLLFAAAAVPLAGGAVNAFMSFPFYRAVPPLMVMAYSGILGAILGREPQRHPLLSGFRRATVTAPWKLAAGLAPVACVVFVFVAHSSARWRKADIHYGFAEGYLKAGRFKLAIAHANQSLKHNPIRKRILFSKGKAELDSGQTDKALATYEEFLKYHPNDTVSWANVSVAHQQKKDFEEAEKWIRRLGEVFFKDGESYALLGQIRSGQHRWKEACEFYEKAITLRLSAHEREVAYNYGIAAMRDGQFEKARDQLAQAAGDSPGMWSAHFYLGVILCDKIKDLESGVKHLKLALESTPPEGKKDTIDGLIKFHSARVRKAPKPAP